MVFRRHDVLWPRDARLRRALGRRHLVPTSTGNAPPADPATHIRTPACAPGRDPREKWQSSTSGVGWAGCPDYGGFHKIALPSRGGARASAHRHAAVSAELVRPRSRCCDCAWVAAQRPHGPDRALTDRCSGLVAVVAGISAIHCAGRHRMQRRPLYAPTCRRVRG